MRRNYCLVGYDDTCADDLDFAFRRLSYNFWTHPIKPLVFPFGMNLTQDFWNEVLQERQSPTKVFRINNLIADVNSLQDGPKTTDKKLFSG